MLSCLLTFSFSLMRKNFKQYDHKWPQETFARSFNLRYRYIDDLIVFSNKKLSDKLFPSQLTVKKANKPDHLASYLDFTFIIDTGSKLSTNLYDKRGDFDFHVVNFPFFSSNIPSGPSHGVYISQLVR